MRHLIALLMSAVLLSGCGDPTRLSTPHEPGAEYVPYKNDSGQLLISVKAEDINAWLAQHKDAEIISLTAVSDTHSHNYTTGFWIVYKQPSRTPIEHQGPSGHYN